MNEIRAEERIKIKLDADDEITERFEMMQDKENFSSASNTDNKYDNIFAKFDSKDESDLDRQLKRKIKNYQSKKALLSDAKSKAFAFLMHNQDQSDDLISDSMITNEERTYQAVNQFDRTQNISKQPKVLHERTNTIESNSEEIEYKCPKCKNSFDNNKHLPLALPSGNFNCKE